MNRWQQWKGIMKAQPFEEKRLNKWNPPYIVQPKFDGFRCRAVPVEGGGYIMLSSEENVIFSAPHILESLNHSGLTVELDGELYNHQAYLQGGFDLISSIASRTTNLHPLHKDLQFHIFDLVTTRAQGDRILDLNRITMPDYCFSSPYWICNSLDEIMQVYEELIVYGYEGIIVRHLFAPYERKRSLWVMKFKPKQEDTYVITDAVEEISINGVPKGTLGALWCSGSDGTPFKVGSGFTSQQRKNLWEEVELLRGKKARIQYQHITSGKGVPRFPIFVEVI